MERRLAAIMATDVVGYSRLIRADEEGTIAALQALRADLIDPKIAEHHGRIVKLMGDGMLAEFASVVDAVRTAEETQRAVAERNAELPRDRRIEFRVGINLGDVVIDGDDIQGDGVNVAARLEGIAEPGGICVSDVVYQSITGKSDLVFVDFGEQQLKNIDTPIRVWNWDPEAVGTAQAPAAADPAIAQQIKFCTASDGVQIAYAVVGSGPPLLKAPNWMHHLEYDWQNPFWGHLLSAMAKDHTLVRFDQRASGLSDWNVAEITFDSMVSDMAAVVDAAGLDRFPLLGVSQGCAYSIAYALKYPERVSRLVLYGGFAKGPYKTGDESDQQDADMQRQMILQGWGQNNPAFRQFFTTLFMPSATKPRWIGSTSCSRKLHHPKTQCAFATFPTILMSATCLARSLCRHWCCIAGTMASFRSKRGAEWRR